MFVSYLESREAQQILKTFMFELKGKEQFWSSPSCHGYDVLLPCQV